MDIVPGKRIAILGATGHIAQTLIDGISNLRQHTLYLFARSLERLGRCLAQMPYTDSVIAKSFNEFTKNDYDVIINCVGLGDPAKVKNAGATVFMLTEYYDNLILNYLDANPKALYINFSSGAAYGTEFSDPAEERTATILDINHLSPCDFYGIAKINSEAKHRAFIDKNIVDLRVFGYFSRYMDLETQYFMSEVISCVKTGKEFLTGSGNIIRDYVHPQDLLSLIEKCITEHHINNVFDVYSLKPATKFEILDFFNKQFGLNYKIKDDIKIAAATGVKNNYYSTNKRAKILGYIPQYTSLQSILIETRAILNNTTKQKYKGVPN